MGKKSRRDRPAEKASGDAAGTKAIETSTGSNGDAATTLAQPGAVAGPKGATAVRGALANAQRDAQLMTQIDDECSDSVCPGTFRWDHSKRFIRFEGLVPIAAARETTRAHPYHTAPAVTPLRVIADRSSYALLRLTHSRRASPRRASPRRVRAARARSARLLASLFDGAELL